jgi:hypothetical protein
VRRRWHDSRTICGVDYDGTGVRIVLFGATGMVGQGVLRECLLTPDVESVLTIVRTAAGLRHAKLREVT